MRLNDRITPLRAAVAASCLALATSVAAQIDVTGTWSVYLDGGFRGLDTSVQNGTALSTGLLGYGTIDPSTGVFHLEQSGECDIPGDDDITRVDGTVTPDGLTFTGTYSAVVIGTPSHPCVRFDGSVAGVRKRGRQTVLGRSLTVKDPNPGIDPSKRRIVGSAKERHSPNTLIGDPTLPGDSGGATLQIFADGAAPSAQEFVLPQGTSGSGKPFWSGSTAEGFKYRDPRGDQGPVKVVSIKRSSGGSFSIKAVVSGKNGAVDVLPPNPGSDGCMALELGLDRVADGDGVTDGDRYSV